MKTLSAADLDRIRIANSVILAQLYLGVREHATCPRCGHPIYHDSEGEYCPNCGPVLK